MRKTILFLFISVFLFSCSKLAQPKTATVPKNELTIIGKLEHISKPADCGYFHFGAVAMYTDLEIVEGNYSEDKIYVVHGCPELARNEYSKGSGSLDSFKEGDYHRLHLTSKNIYKIEVIEPGDIQLPIDFSKVCLSECDAQTFVQLQDGMMYFSSQVDLNSK